MRKDLKKKTEKERKRKQKLSQLKKSDPARQRFKKMSDYSRGRVAIFIVCLVVVGIVVVLNVFS